MDNKKMSDGLGESLTAELNEADALAEAEAGEERARPHRWTRQEAARAAELSRQSRAKRRDSKPPGDAEIERGLRERAVSDPRAAEILLRWLQRPRPVDETPGVDLESMSEAQLERLYAGLTRLATLPEDELQALIGNLLVGESDARP